MAGAVPALLRQRLDRGESAGIADDRGRSGLPLQPDAERQHRALAEAHQRQRARPEIVLLQLGVEKGIERGRGVADAAHQLARIAEGEVEPLPAHGRRAARLRRMRRDERGMRQGARPFPPQADQVVAVGAIAMQEHDQLARRAAGRRGQSWSVER